VFDIVEQFLHGWPSQNDTISSVECTPDHQRKSMSSKHGIAYDGDLISRLRGEHEVLIEEFGLTFKDGYESGDLELLCEKLGDFKTLFQSHLARENVKLFGYLEQEMKDDASSLNVMRQLRKEMNGCSKTVIGFCKKYARPIDALILHETFKDEYRDVGQALIHRIQIVEKEMYSLYCAIQ